MSKIFLALDNYEQALLVVQEGNRAPVDIEDYSMIHPFALTALAARARTDCTSSEPLRLVECNLSHSGSRWAWDGMGLEAAIDGSTPQGPGEEGRTAKLRRISGRAGTGLHAKNMARLVAPKVADTQKVLEYVFDELMRNAVQHSSDPLGGVACAQRMDPNSYYSNKVIQLAVADCGVGIQQSLSGAHGERLSVDESIVMAMEPHVSGAFAPGTYGSSENAGMGLFVVSEIVKRTAGKLLIATRGGSLFLKGDLSFGQNHSSRGEVLGFPGTLVAFEIPLVGESDSPLPDSEFADLLSVILAAADSMPSSPVAQPALSFTDGGPAPGALMAAMVIGDLAASGRLREQLLKLLVAKREAHMDFLNVTFATQSQAHSLLFEPIRVASAMRSKIVIHRASSATERVLRFLEGYALGGSG